MFGNQQDARAKTQGFGGGRGNGQTDEGVGHQQIGIRDRSADYTSGTNRRVYWNDGVFG